MDREMEIFLRRRCVPEETIEKMKNDKIDKYVVEADDNVLKEYLEVGDRVALKHFCRSGDVNKNKRKKESILERLRRKINLPGEQSDAQDSMEKESKKKKVHLMGNMNAVKKTRIIEIGWINYRVTDKQYHQVRAKNGGIPRKQEISKDSTKSDILEMAKDKFFPRGKSKLGNLDDFECDLLDFSEEAVNAFETVAEMYERTGIKRLRFNLATKYRYIEDENSGENSSGEPSKTLATETKPKTTHLSASQKIPTESRQTSTPKIQSLVQTSHQPDGTFSCSDIMNPQNAPSVLCEEDSDPEIIFGGFSCTIQNCDEQNETLPYKTDINRNACKYIASETSLILQAAVTAGIDTEQDSLEVQDSSSLEDPDIPPRPPTPPPVNEAEGIPPRSPTPPPVNDTEHCITIRRAMIESEMIGNFIDPTILREKLKFKFIDERGVDVSGVSREAYTSFWVEFLESSAVGETERVPIIKASMQQAEWESVGRILAKGYIDHGVFPLRLSKVFTIALLYGESNISNSVLMDSFMNYIAGMEKEVVTKALSGCLDDEDDRDEFIDLLQRMGCRNIPSKEETRRTILNVAHKELIHTPKYALDNMSSTAKKYLQDKLPNLDSIIDMYESKILTNKKVIRLFQPQRDGKEEERTLQFLKQYVKGLDEHMLKCFVRHVTGSDMLCVDKIEIHFNDRKGLLRMPVVRTCTPMIELSTNYSNYTEMRAEFTALLKVHHPLDID